MGVKGRLKQVIERWRRLSFAVGVRTARGPVTRMLIISDGRDYTSEQQFAPFRRHERRLRRELGLFVLRLPLNEALCKPAAYFRRFELVGVKLSFRTPARQAGDIIAHFKEMLAATGARLVYFDGDDDSAVQWPAVIGAVDLYVKKHVFADRSWYQRGFIGKHNLTDHLAREHGCSFADDPIPETAPLRPEDAAKIWLGWNIGLDDKIARLARELPLPPGGERPFDICSRAPSPPGASMSLFRRPLIDLLDGMSGRFKVKVGQERVSQSEYYQEMLGSKICVSPFGYGELCWRDFEAILCGCLLVKPDMGHIETLPDIFAPGITYVPIRWDYSDLEEVCARYLGDAEARERIVSEARAALLQSLEPEWFVGRVRALLAAAKVGAPALSA